MNNYIIGVDIGTQGTKAMLFDLDLNVISSAFEPSRLVSPKPGCIWQEPDDLYLSCARTIKELMDKSGKTPNSILSIGIDGQMAGIMGIDSKGEAVTYYDSWLDVRSAEYTSRLQQLAGNEAVSRSGGQITSNQSTKILWWKYQHPEIYRKIAKFVLPHSYVIGRMTGLLAEQSIFDYTCLHFNSFSDNFNKSWNKPLLKDAGIDADKFPRIASPFEILGGITYDFAKLSGLCEGIPVAAGAGDTAAGTFGSGMFESNLTMDIAGTASVMCCSANSYSPDTTFSTLNLMRSPVDGIWLPLAYINGGGMCIKWLRDNFTGTPHIDYNSLEHEAALVPAGSEGVLFCPHFSGRVLPANAKMKGCFLGLDFKHTRAHLFRAVMEAIAFEYRYYLSVMKQCYPDAEFESMLCTGGGANSDLFNQIKADILGLTLTTFETADTALLGSAVIAAVGAGVYESYKAPIQKSLHAKAVFRSNSATVSTYEKSYNDYQQMLISTSEFYNADAKINGGIKI